jgi:hypothetical protein
MLNFGFNNLKPSLKVVEDPVRLGFFVAGCISADGFLTRSTQIKKSVIP